MNDNMLILSRRIIGKLVLLIIILLNSSSVANAQSLELDFDRLFEDHGSIMMLTGLQTGSIEYANQAAVEFYGYTMEQLMSMKMADINTLNLEERTKEMQTAVNEGRNYFVYQHRIASGEIRTVEVYSSPYLFKDKALLLSIIHDITAETQLEEKNQMLTTAFFLGFLLIIIFLLSFSILLFRNYKRLKNKNHEINTINQLRKTFFDADSRLIYIKDENLKYIAVNKAFEKFYHKEADEIMGGDDFALTDLEFAEIRIKTDFDVLAKKKPLVCEVKWDNRVYKTNKFPIKLLNGQYGIGAYIEDVTVSSDINRKIKKTLLRNSILVEVFSQSFDSSHDQFNYVLSKALELTESKFGYIYLYNEESQELILNSWSKDIMLDCAVTEKLTRYQLKNTGLWGEAVRQRKSIVINDFEMPNTMKKGYPEGHVKLTKFMTIPVKIDEEIVAVVGLANKEDDYEDNDVDQITLLMNGVWNAKERRQRTIELQKASIALKENKDNLQLILNSTAEAIYGIDNSGHCTFCNASCLRMLGYKHHELIGRNMHLMIHHSRKDGTLITSEECHVFKALMVGEGAHVDDEVFWRVDGTSFDVEYFSYPQTKDGEIIGAVVTFLDITERKKSEDNIRYLSYHDSLTGLYNRMFFEEEFTRLDTERNLPMSIIVGDVNGLKLINDIFGHAAGDTLLRTISETFKKVCRADDIIARIGGDEFVILLPNTNGEKAEEISLRIKNEFSKEQIRAIKGSISMGCETKVFADQDIEKVMELAEDKMYREKTLNRKSINSNLIETIIKTIHETNPKEAEHSNNVSELCLIIGRAMNLSDVELRRLKEVGSLHDIGKITLDEKVLKKVDAFTDREIKEIKEHPVVGYRILNSFDDTLDLAESVLAHHERWDGSGYPKGLKGEEIPKFARIVTVAESYDAMVNRQNKHARSKAVAIQEMRKQAGLMYDPDIVEIFVKMILEDVKNLV